MLMKTAIGIMLDRPRLILKQTRIELIQGFFSLPSPLVPSTPSHAGRIGFLSLYCTVRDFLDYSEEKLLLKKGGAVLASILLTKNSRGKKIEQAQKETLTFMATSRRGKVVREIFWGMKANFLSRFPPQRAGSALPGAFGNWGQSLESQWSVNLSHVPSHCKLKCLAQKKALARNRAGGFSWSTESFISAFWHCGFSAALYQLGVCVQPGLCMVPKRVFWGGRTPLHVVVVNIWVPLFYSICFKTLLELRALRLMRPFEKKRLQQLELPFFGPVLFFSFNWKWKKNQAENQKACKDHINSALDDFTVCMCNIFFTVCVFLVMLLILSCGFLGFCSSSRIK